MSDRKCAVLTGGAGFLGSHLADRLLGQGIDVVCLDNFVTGSVDNVAHLAGRDDFRLVRTDVTGPMWVPGSIDYVIHFASPASPTDYAELPIQTLKVGSVGTMNALDLARAKGARFLLASTSETYGDPLVHPQPETYWGNVNPIGPRACYDEAKRFAEAATMSYRQAHGVDTAIVRIFNTYGPRMRPNDGRAIPNFIGQALAGQPITVHGDGGQTRSICYVDDLIEGILRLLFSGESGPVNVGNPEELTMLQIAMLVREIVGSESPIEFVGRPTDDPERRKPDISLARELLDDWQPKVAMLDGLRRTTDYFRERSAGRGALVRPRTSPENAGAASTRHRVAVVGTGYVGAVTATCLAWLGHEVCGLDLDPARAGQLSRGQATFFEPQLPEMLNSALSTGRLRFTHEPAEALSDADFVFLCVGTPGGLAGLPDTSQIEEALRSLAPFLRDGMVVINKSTVPVGSGDWARTMMEEALGRDRRPAFHVVSNPEFLREGSAISDFLYPDRIVLGGDEVGVRRVTSLYRPVLDQSFPEGRRRFSPKLITSDLASAEMIKYAANAFLATKISFANEMANICELVGADVRQVLPAIGADHRIGAQFLSPGIGWGGSCFGKDVAALIAMGQDHGYTSTMLRATVDINQGQRVAAVRKLQRHLRVLKGRRIAVLGLAFKPGTDDLRDAPALDIIRRLLVSGAVVTGYDPVVKELPAEFDRVRIATDVYDASEFADAVVVATDWAEFEQIEPHRLRQVMRGDLVLDGRNVMPARAFEGSGLRIEGFGW